MFHATKIRLYPNAAQQDLIARQLGCVRFVWNKALDVKKVAWRERRESLSIHTLITMLPVWKARDYPWLKEADSQALQMTLRHLDRAYTNFFAHRAGFPRFKKKQAPRQSYAYPQRVKVEGDKVFLPKVGWVKAVVHREIAPLALGSSTGAAGVRFALHQLVHIEGQLQNGDEAPDSNFDGFFGKEPSLMSFLMAPTARDKARAASSTERNTFPGKTAWMTLRYD